MTRFLGMLVILCAMVAVVGFWRGWFHTESHDGFGQHSVTVTVDKDKFDQDKANVRQDVQNLGNK
jgi:hypothetical protein